ncbi:hypothetical protein M885DRAFT_414318, partial [Pelagophyceae sp. CCMP2097]
ATRLRLAQPDSRVQILALTLLDVCVKNGDSSVRRAVAVPGLMKDLSLLCEKGEKGANVAAMKLVEQWGVAFSANTDVPLFQATFEALKSKGLEF